MVFKQKRYKFIHECLAFASMQKTFCLEKSISFRNITYPKLGLTMQKNDIDIDIANVHGYG